MLLHHPWKIAHWADFEVWKVRSSQLYRCLIYYYRTGLSEIHLIYLWGEWIAKGWRISPDTELQTIKFQDTPLSPRFDFTAYTSLFINKRFALNEMFQRNASKFAIFYVSENPCSFFRFSFHATLYFYLMST